MIDDNWITFLKENNFLVGLSLDGPQHIHDKYRVMKGGQGSWEKVTKSAELMLNASVEVNALTVLNNYSAQFPEEIYNYHKSLNLNFMQFIPCLESDLNEDNIIAPFSLTPELYGTFLIKIFDLWFAEFEKNRATTSIRLFDSLFHHYAGYSPPQCTLMEECGVYVVVEHSGDVYACDFYVEPEWKLGNVKTDKLVEMLNSEKQKVFGELKGELPEECLACAWLSQCQGGCPKDRVINPTNKKLNYFCKSYKMLFEHSDIPFQRLTKSWKKEQLKLSEKGFSKNKIGRNDSCFCGSGKKFKNCCMDLN